MTDTPAQTMQIEEAVKHLEHIAAYAFYERDKQAFAAVLAHVQQWQDIASAPTNKVVSVYNPRAFGVITAFQTICGNWLSTPGRYGISPTHWQYLPKPPVTP